MSDDDAPRQLPPGPRYFVNRDDELAAVRRVLDESVAGTAVTVLSGLPGVGKTALAVKAVERHRGTFDGGELFVEFGGGLSVGDALAAGLRALGVADSVLPSSLADRVGLYRTRTARWPVLVVLDDVTDPAQVTPLVPTAPGSVVLVTSTARLGELLLDGAEVVDVAPLDGDAGARMVRELVGPRVDAEPKAVARLVVACGGLPIAIRAMAARLIARRSLTVADLAAEIEREREGLLGPAAIAAVFAVAYRQLPEDTARMYRALSALPGSEFDSALAECAGTALDDLVEAGLVQDGPDGRFRVHSLVGVHARDRSLAEDPEPTRTAVARRAVEHLLVRAAYADQAVLGPDRYRCVPDDVSAGHDDPFDGDKDPAMRWLDAERANLAAGIRAAVDHGWHDAAWQLAESATALYVKRRYLVDWTETSALGARAAALAGNPAAEARLRSFASRPWTELGDPTRARAEIDAAFAIATDDVRLLASIHEMDGRHHDATGDHAAAVAAFACAVRLFASVDDRRGVAFVTYFLGCARLRAGDGGLSTLEQALPLVRAQNDSRMTGRTLVSVASALSASGDDPAARTRLDEAIAILRAGSDSFQEAEAQEALADLALRAGDRALARDCLRRARDLHTALGSGRIDELERRLVSLSEG